VASKKVAPAQTLHANQPKLLSPGVIVTTTTLLDYVPKIRSSLTWLGCKKDIIDINDDDSFLDNGERTSIIDLLGKGIDETKQARLATATVDLKTKVGGKSLLCKVKSDVNLWVQRMKDAKKKSDEAEVLVAQGKREDARSASQALMRFLPQAELAVTEEALYGVGNPDVVVQRSGSDLLGAKPYLYCRDIQTLLPRVWLNEAIIDYYMHCLCQRQELCGKRNKKKTKEPQKLYFFRTHMFSQIHPSFSGGKPYSHHLVARGPPLDIDRGFHG
jgi:hypothetical protein